MSVPPFDPQDFMHLHHPTLLSPGEELVNSITHGLGCLLSLIGSGVMLRYAFLSNDPWRIASAAIFSFTLVGVYAASTLSHVFRQPQRRQKFRMLDQGFIYLLIAGTFTPFALVYLRSGGWWVLTGLIWGAALLGFWSKVAWAHQVEGVSTWIYVVLGWLPTPSAFPLIELISTAGLYWMLLGGLCYSAGTIFLIFDRKVLHFHAVWHLMVIAGSTCHYVAILFYIMLPQTAK